MEKLTVSLTEKEVYQYCIDQIKNTKRFPYICNVINDLEGSKISESFANKLREKIQNRKNIPKSLKNHNYLKDSSAIWDFSEREMRIKYLEHLIKKL